MPINENEAEPAHLSVIAICSNMAEPVFAFQLPEMEVLLKPQQQKRNILRRKLKKLLQQEKLMRESIGESVQKIQK